MEFCYTSFKEKVTSREKAIRISREIPKMLPHFCSEKRAICCTFFVVRLRKRATGMFSPLRMMREEAIDWRITDSRGRLSLQGLRVVLLLVADRGRFVNRPYGVVRRGNVGRRSRDVEGAVPYNGYLCEQSDKSKFEAHSGYAITFLW